PGGRPTPGTGLRLSLTRLEPRRSQATTTGLAAGTTRAAGHASSASTADTAIRKRGYSQPPPGLVNTQPLGAGTNVAPTRNGISAIETTLVRTFASISAPPTASAAIVT